MAGATISQRALAEIFERSEGVIRLWIRKRLLMRTGNRYSENDAVQAATINFLIGKNFSYDVVRGVMNAIRRGLTTAPSSARLRLVCHPQRFTGTLIVGDDDSAVLALGHAIPHERRIIVFDITEAIGRIRAD